MQAPAVGELCADMMLGRDPAVDLQPLRPSRFAEGDYTAERAVI